MDNIKNLSEDFLNKINFIIERYEKNQKELEYLRNEELDLRHELELGSHNAVQLVKLSKELQRCYQDIRKIKNEIELLEPIYEVVSKPDIQNRFQKAYKMVSQKYEQIPTRQYYPRVRNDLTINSVTHTQHLKNVLESNNAS